MAVKNITTSCASPSAPGTGVLSFDYDQPGNNQVLKIKLINSQGVTVKTGDYPAVAGRHATIGQIPNGTYKLETHYYDYNLQKIISSEDFFSLSINCTVTFNTLAASLKSFVPALDNGVKGSAEIAIHSEKGIKFQQNLTIIGSLRNVAPIVWRSFSINAARDSATYNFNELSGGSYIVDIQVSDGQPDIHYPFTLRVDVAPVKIGDQLSFLPWVKHKLGRAAAPPVTTLRPTLPITLTVEVADGSKQSTPEIITTNAELYGPGDVIGLNPTAVLRTTPNAQEQRFSPLQVASIEFGEEDLPWRYTPENVPETNRLRPWCFLLVLEEDEFSLQPQGNTPLPIVEVAAGVHLPTPSQLWLWAHVQVNRVLDTSDSTVVDDFLQGALLQNPALAFSRLLSPRRLKPNARYQAFLLPTYEAGRQAGMGGSVPVADALKSAWPEGPAGQASYTLTTSRAFPVYYQWGFQTGEGGDFESLARLIQPTSTEIAGANTLAIQLPGATAGTTNPYTLQLPGVLEPWDSVEPALPTAVATDMYRVLQPGLEPGLVSTTGRPVVVPPVYGQAYMATPEEEVAASGTWQRQVNIDPRYRAIAGLGSQLVQEQQEEYMRRAWEQVKDIVVANQNLRSLQLGLEASAALRRQHLPVEPAGALAGMASAEGAVAAQEESETVAVTPVPELANYGLQLTGMALSRIRLSATGLSARETIRRSNVPLAAFSPTFRRLLRPLGPYQVNLVGRPLRPTQDPTATADQDPLGPGTGLRQRDELLSHLQSGQLRAAAPKSAFFRAYQFDDIALNGLLADQSVLPNVLYVLDAQGYREVVDAGMLAKFGAAFAPLRISTRFRTIEPIQPALDITALKSSVIIGTDPERVLTARAKRALRVVPRVYHGDFDSRDFDARDFVVDTPIENLTVTPTSSAIQSETLQPAAPIPLRPLNSLRTNANEIAVPPIRPVRTHPVFKDALGDQLRKRHPELLLPGLADFPQNSVAVMQLNRAFIEAFLLGANHALGSELAWREFPVDLQGTFFRQFWDVTDYLQTQPVAAASIGAVADRENRLRDITPLQQWGTSALGEHPNHTASAQIVLVIRAELLQRFPTTVICAQPAQDVMGSTTNEKEPNPDLKLVRYPLYRLPIGQDLVALAFNLTPSEVNGYFFTFSQRPNEPQFGLDKHDLALSPVPATIRYWNQLSWEFLGVAVGENLRIDPVGKPNPLAETIPRIRTSAELAYALFQQPVMVAVPAQRII